MNNLAVVNANEHGLCSHAVFVMVAKINLGFFPHFVLNRFFGICNRLCAQSSSEIGGSITYAVIFD